MFKVKDANLHPSCKIYIGKCSCGSTYVGETVRNVEERWNEHNNTKMKSEPAKHLSMNRGHNFDWSNLVSAPTDSRTRKNLEVFYIAKMKPDLNEQVQSNILNLFRHGVT